VTAQVFETGEKNEIMAGIAKENSWKLIMVDESTTNVAKMSESKHRLSTFSSYEFINHVDCDQNQADGKKFEAQGVGHSGDGKKGTWVQDASLGGC
jgi:hypothetical protein